MSELISASVVLKARPVVRLHMEIFNQDGAKIDKFNEILAQKAKSTSGVYQISTQTYSSLALKRLGNRGKRLTPLFPRSEG